jgi:hypothetical protein
MAKQRLSIILDEDLVKRLDQTASALGLSRSALIQQLCDDGLQEVEVSAKVLSDPVVSGAMLSALTQPGVIRSMMGVMREELTSEQLDLFGKAISSAAGALGPVPKAKKLPPARRRPSPRKGKRE